MGQKIEYVPKSLSQNTQREARKAKREFFLGERAKHIEIFSSQESV